MSGCPVSPVMKFNKMLMPELVRFRYQIRGTQSGTGMLWYQTEMMGAGMSRELASMLMPSYVYLLSAIVINDWQDYRPFNVTPVEGATCARPHQRIC